MPKLSIQELKNLRTSEKKRISMREGEFRGKLTVHLGTCGIAAGARDIMDTFLDALEDRNLDDILFTSTGCAGLCSQEPMITVEMEGQPPVKYGKLTGERAITILDDHILGGNVVESLALGMGSERVG